MIQSVALNMVVYNEAHRIYSTLAKISPYVREIVIVDQSSTDDTVEKIRSWENSFLGGVVCGVTIIEDKHHGFCEPSRIKAWEQTKSDWILVLDADERISQKFADEMFYLDEKKFRGCKMQRSFFLDGNHRFTGDYQYRYFRRDCVKFLNKIHTEPQPFNLDYKREIYSTPYPAIIHEKNWEEQLRDELEYERLIPILDGKGQEAEVKLSLNVHLNGIRERGLTPEQVVAMTPQERKELGI